MMPLGAVIGAVAGLAHAGVVVEVGCDDLGATLGQSVPAWRVKARVPNA